MKNIYVKKGIIGGTSAWCTNKDHKLNDGDFIRIMRGNHVLGIYVVKHSEDNRDCFNCPLDRYKGTKICVFKRNDSGTHETLCSDINLAYEGKLIHIIDIMDIAENL